MSWSVIASTAGANANVNALVTTRVFNMNGELLATGYADFWDGSHTTGVGIDYTEYGNGLSANVWTGSLGNGTAAGANALGNATAIWGEAAFGSVGWIWHGTQNTTFNYKLYALSETLTAPIPEPETWATMLAGLGLVAAAWRRNRARVPV